MFTGLVGLLPKYIYQSTKHADSLNAHLHVFRYNSDFSQPLEYLPFF